MNITPPRNPVAGFTCGSGWWDTSGTLRNDSEVHIIHARGLGEGGREIVTIKRLMYFEGGGEKVTAAEFLAHPERVVGMRPVARRRTGIDRLGTVIDAEAGKTVRALTKVAAQNLRPGDFIVPAGGKEPVEVLRVTRPVGRVRATLALGHVDFAPVTRVLEVWR